MIKMIALKCPECGAKLQIEDGRKECFCQYCGHKILLDDGSVDINMNVNTTHTYHKVDDARLKEAEVDKLIRLKELEIKQKELDRKAKGSVIKVLITIVAIFIMCVAEIAYMQRSDWVMNFIIMILFVLVMGNMWGWFKD